MEKWGRGLKRGLAKRREVDFPTPSFLFCRATLSGRFQTEKGEKNGKEERHGERLCSLVSEEALEWHVERGIARRDVGIWVDDSDQPGAGPAARRGDGEEGWGQSMSEWRKGFDAELAFSGVVDRGARGIQARRVQEWLTLHKHAIKIDGSFGRITEAAVIAFQEEKGLTKSGTVDEETWAILVEPMAKAVASIPAEPGDTLGSVFRRTVLQHLENRPREVGGNNCGPWVRGYMRGHDNNEGGDADWNWCAGSVTTMLLQAAETLGVEPPISYQINCNRLADAAKKAGLFLDGESPDRKEAPTTGIFLEEKTDSTYRHTGAYLSVKNDVVETVEGNFGSGVNGRMARYRRTLEKNDIIPIA